MKNGTVKNTHVQVRKQPLPVASQSKCSCKAAVCMTSLQHFAHSSQRASWGTTPPQLAAPCHAAAAAAAATLSACCAAACCALRLLRFRPLCYGLLHSEVCAGPLIQADVEADATQVVIHCTWVPASPGVPGSGQG